MPLQLMPDYIYQQFTASGKPLSGGTVYFYESGTLTPKTVWADAAGSTPLGTSVALSAAGTAVIFLGEGAYRIWIKDSTGAPVAPWVDGIVGSQGVGIPGTNATVGFFRVYNDLRALSAGPDVAYVTGATDEGDGGAGWFQIQPGSTTADDGGIFLTAAGGSLVYKRVFDAVVNPEWFGVHYDVNADQSAALLLALSASAAVNLPVLVAKRVYLTQNLTVPIAAAMVAGDDGFFNAPSNVTMTFQSGTRFEGRGVCFGSGVQPLFAAGTVDALRLSWMGGIDSDRWARLLASTTARMALLMDVSTLLTNDLTIPANLPLEPVGGAVLTFEAFANLSIGSLDFQARVQFLAFSSTAYVGPISIGAPACYPEWFGAVGDGTTDDSRPMYIAAKSGRADLDSDKTYLLGPPWASFPTPTPWVIQGGAVQLDASVNLGTGTLSLQDTHIIKASGSWFAGAVLIANQSEIPQTYTAAVQSVTGCVITGSDKFPRFRGAPRLDNGHLDLLSAHLLRTNADGKIIDAGRDLTLDSLIVVKLILTSLASAPTLRIFSGSIVLTNPMPMFLAVITASYSTSEIFLPIPVKANNDPNIIFVFRREIWDGQEYKLKSQYGNFYKTGTPNSEVFKDYIIAYYDYDGPGWVTFSSN